MYLRHSVKDGSAKGVIEGLSRSGEQYNEAIESLQTRYNRPRLIHQAHVWKILEVSSLKEGSGRELRYLHDVVQQHLHALKSMYYEPSGPFISSVLELKLDPNTTFEWQKHSQGTTDVPHYRELLEFINLRAQASESSVLKGARKGYGNEGQKNPGFSKPVATFTASATTPAVENCVLCKNSKHLQQVQVSTLRENASHCQSQWPLHELFEGWAILSVTAVPHTDVGNAKSHITLCYTR